MATHDPRNAPLPRSTDGYWGGSEVCTVQSREEGGGMNTNGKGKMGISLSGEEEALAVGK